MPSPQEGGSMLRPVGKAANRLLQDQCFARSRALDRLSAAQQPAWATHPDLPVIRDRLTVLPGLVDQHDIRALRHLLSRVEAGAGFLLHVGECAETFPMADPGHVDRRLSLYRELADRLAQATSSDVVLVTRMAGQYAKPRTESAERLSDGTEAATYRGDAVNDRAADPDARRPDPARMIAAYQHARSTLDRLHGRTYRGNPIFVSHEALLRDFEDALTGLDERITPGRPEAAHYVWARHYAMSTHLPWIGERTRQAGNWHVQWAAGVANPVAVKLGPTAARDDVAGLITALNPRRERGRLGLITRLGAGHDPDRLAALAGTVVTVGAPVLWQCDPLHGNTRKVGSAKFRLLPDVRAEISAFVRTLRTVGAHPAGLHLEVTPDDVAECYETAPAADTASSAPVDPRLNPRQALEIIDHFAREVTR
ncbi:MAG TPA: 3-deoxy-7-phosphoheptulonate synthase [Actinoplanes sp.]|nr:3-deoxy-7-phosphoheptulonate synthase [Actinoplanes sp.]